VTVHAETLRWHSRVLADVQARVRASAHANTQALAEREASVMAAYAAGLRVADIARALGVSRPIVERIVAKGDQR
jgi:DNA-binding NarL/FixJ family response regulator